MYLGIYFRKEKDWNLSYEFEMKWWNLKTSYGGVRKSSVLPPNTSETL